MNYYLTFCDKKILWPLKVLVHLHYRHVSLLHGISLFRVTKVCVWGWGSKHPSPFMYYSNHRSHYRWGFDNISVTIDRVHFGARAGIPTIGNNVTLFVGSNVIGNVKIGNNVIVNFNSVVTHDVPDNAIIVGVPAKILRINK
mgnify:CR=1 FL=1